ncbi:MAG TPA: Rieske 2Fe-2S domain-containing protein [Ramlibacter sp.]|uniref:aromatic ring-hydroxylating oxygenase subunit alpha n=1 Tax=Ramlibacter sp. TaxID=1917967 RepID=UPI002CB9D239|nr:Rieske 2Fe-2S domain-containing protein [Ramlibacter sp.]HVZ46549.1 Rieske 2Fe-2S domain-containing protein [Ramlibacter sp.]
MTDRAPSSMLEVCADGRARLDRRAYTSASLYDREMQGIWHRTWVYLAHESEVPTPHAYVTRRIGRQPVIVIRDDRGEIRAFMNACTHRGAMLLSAPKGQARTIVCPYHAWTFGSGGDLVGVTGEAAGAYPPSFDKSTLGLEPVAKIDSYRGFIFGTLDPGAISLADHLGDASTCIDLLVDQSLRGWEVLKGVSTYSYDGNWKLQAENAVDGYHAPVVHANFSATIENRKRCDTAGSRPGSMKMRHDPRDMHGGFFDLGRGHLMIWRDWDNPQDRFNYGQMPEFEQRMGSVRARWAVGRLRNLLIFPNLMIMDQMSTQLRVIQPIAVDRTEVTGYAFAPAGEPADQRRKRLRFYEDFFNPSGMATPDDLEIFNRSQQAFAAEHPRFSDMSRGAAHQVEGPDRFAQELGIRPKMSGGWIQDEGLFVGMYRAWAQYLSEGGIDG